MFLYKLISDYLKTDEYYDNVCHRNLLVLELVRVLINVSLLSVRHPVIG